MVMPSNNGKAVVHYWAGRYAGLLGHLYSPEGFRGPFPWLPYALDNGAFGAFTNGTAWDADAFLALCNRAAAGPQAPRWVVVPDVVGDRAATLARWDEWAPRLRRLYGWPLALAVQDGMTADDARAAGADVVRGRHDPLEAAHDRALLRATPPRPCRPDQFGALALGLRGSGRGEL
jgi:hypothetical protein